MRAAPSRSLVALALAVAACAPRPRERLVVGVPHHPAVALVHIAAAKGYFAARGLDLEVRPFASGRDAVAALGAGRIDAAAAYSTPVVLRAGRDGALRVLTSLHVSNGNTRLVARPGLGIAAGADLAGKRVGVPHNTNAEYFLDVLLAWSGVSPREVRVVDVRPDAIPDALASGDVDAVAIWTPHAERARRLVGEGAVELRAEVYTELSMLVTRAPALAARRRAFVALVAALADAERLARERPEEALAALRAAFPELAEADLAAAWRRLRPTLGVTHQLASALEDESRWFRALGRAEGAPLDVGVLLAADVLAEVDPEAVTFVPPDRPAGGE